LTTYKHVEKYFLLLGEISSIEQLSRHQLEAQLPDGLIAPHFAVLNYLVRVEDGQMPLTLARAFQVPKTSMTHTLAGLEKKRLVKMRPNPADARSKMVWITDKGKVLIETTMKSVAPNLLKITEAVSPNELEQLLPILTRLREYLDDNRLDE